jgi:hypothetical protein
MKKLLLILSLCLSTIISAQLPNLSIAPDWTLTDVNGTTHSLYDYLDNNYTVFLDFSAVWCGPCWSYHTGGTLEDLYTNHGPSGFPSVSANTTDDVMVFMIEGDANALACLYGVGCNTQGDWVAGTPYPIFCTDGTVNNDNVTSAYAISYWPTIYMICPDRILIEAGQSNNPYSLLNCNPAANLINDPRVMPYSGASVQCDGTIAPEITIMNNGINNLVSLDVEVDVSGATTFNTTVPWTGNLSTYQSTNFILPTITGLQGYEFIMVRISNPNGGVDGDLGNNVLGFTAYPPGQAGIGQLTASISQSGNSLTANAVNGNPPYTYLWSDGQTTQTIAPIIGGSYSVVVEDVNGCVSDPITHLFTITTGLKEVSATDVIYYGTYDILGRTINDLSILSPGAMYIKNGKKFIK